MTWPRDFIETVGVEPYYKDGHGVIYCADCMEVMRDIPDGSVDLVVTDIPYGEVNRAAGNKVGIRKLHKGDADVVTFDLSDLIVNLLIICRGSFYMFCSTEQVSEIRHRFVDSDLTTRHGYWEKDNPSPHLGQHVYLSTTENVIFGKAAGSTFNAHCRKPIWHSPVVYKPVHPTQKPLSIIKDMIVTSSNPGDIVLDPFLGSGTTAVAAKQLGRRWIGIEINPDYCKIAEDRLRQTELAL